MIANYFGFKFTSPTGEERIHKYKITTIPECPSDSEIFRKLCGRSRKQIHEVLGFCVFFRDSVYALVNCDDIPTQNLFPSKEEQQLTYQVKCNWVQQIKKEDVDMLIFFKIFLNRMMEKSGLIQIGFGKHFDPSRQRELKDAVCWPGYSTSLSTYQSGVLFTVNPTNKFIMQKTAYDVIRGTRGSNTKENIAQELNGRGVMTTYNKRIYRIEEVSYKFTPKDTFKLKEKGMLREISYIEYYKEKYNVDIKHDDQPLLIHINERTMQKIFLVPECCLLTGITDELKAKNSRDMRDILFANAEAKYKRIQTFFDHLLNNEKCKVIMESWKVSLD